MCGTKKFSEFTKLRSHHHFKHNGILYTDQIKKKTHLMNK